MPTATNNNGNIKRLPINLYKVSAGDIINYLQNQLGFKVNAKFERCMGAVASPAHAYIIMKVALFPKDIVSPRTGRPDFIDRFMAANSVGTEFKSSVIDVLDKYSYPKSMVINNELENLNRLASIGLYSDKIKEIYTFSQLHYSREQNVYGIYLNVEKIIRDILSDPSTGKPEGEIRVISTTGDNDTIVWNIVESSENFMFYDDGNAISIDAIFRNS